MRIELCDNCYSQNEGRALVPVRILVGDLAACSTDAPAVMEAGFLCDICVDRLQRLELGSFSNRHKTRPREVPLP
jgi:hypothetical protein